ncbi:type II toxin-antitoxin system antitoxin SocA domain-containing protein [Chryseobacterium sp. Marseille-Q3244]|uniref:Panacea domain-containing protein n=1 Tax=Chryseobacterium sp. Marseille-Q3244 TaxID=2758092 RepID=UPI002025B11D|nr:type II toxin-antitoxin system antitoxin SocA domain-containing protein [Chryseobacterium sp. Marseille-Q3244]
MRTVGVNLMSDYIIAFCQNMGVRISPLKIQKLLYYIQAWHIAKFNKAQLFNELPEAWVNGPVYRSVYNSYKSSFFKNEAISTELDESELYHEIKELQNKLNLHGNQVLLIDAVLQAYAKLSDERLVLMTHSEKPWNKAREGLSPIERSGRKLNIDDMYDYFNKITNA